MRPIKLTISGVNSFVEEQTVDFEAAGADNLFCISGCTGSGKTTILDSIILALYGNQSERGLLSDYINLKCDEATIDFVFELSGETYETVRKISRKNGKNFMILKDSGGNIIADGDGAFRFLSEKIGLDVKEFTNVVVLQQGRFSRFLKATKSERVKTVGRLFNLERFSELYPKFNAQASNLNIILSERENVLSGYAGVTDELIELKKKEAAEFADALSAANKESEKAKATAAAARKGREDYLAFERLSEKVKALDATLAETKLKLSIGQNYTVELALKEKALLEREQKRDGLIERRSVLGGMDEEYRKLALKEKQLLNSEENLEAERLAAEKARGELAGLDGESERLSAERLAVMSDENLSFIKEQDVDGAKCDELLLEWTAIASEKAGRELAEKNTKNECEKREREKKTASEKVAAAHDFTAKAGENFEKKKAEYESLRKTYDELVRSDALAVITGSLKEGDTCPVCGEKIKKLTVTATALPLVSEQSLKEMEEEKTEAERGYTAAQLLQSSAESDFKNASAAEKEARVNLENAQKRNAEFSLKVINGTLSALKKLKSVLERSKELKLQREKKAATLALMTANYDKTVLSVKGEREAFVAEKKALDEKAGADYKAELERVKAELDALTEERRKLDELKKKSDARIAELNATILKAEGEKAATTAQIKPCPEVTEERVKQAENAEKDADKRHVELVAAAERARNELAALESDMKKKSELIADMANTKKKRDKLEEMAKLFSRGAFSEFVAGEYVKEFTRSASVILGELTGGKYSLYYDEKSGDFAVADFLAGNEKRSVKTLSGGETFLASLALAIAISKELSKNRNYEFFFIDEGFGTLSEDALDTVTAALENLAKDTLVGVITHRSELIERIPSVIRVERADEERGSRIIF